MTEPSAQRLEEEMNAISEAVSQAARAVQQGRTVDLTALGGRVEGLCAALVTLPGADARRIGASLPAITEILDDIARTLVDRGAGNGPGGSDSPASHERAAHAYGATSSRGRR
jgi:hypothetical protein